MPYMAARRKWAKAFYSEEGAVRHGCRVPSLASCSSPNNPLVWREEAMACGIGVCMTCVLPVIGTNGATRMVRSCVEGPVFRGDRVRWRDINTIPADAIGAPDSGGES